MKKVECNFKYEIGDEVYFLDLNNILTKGIIRSISLHISKKEELIKENDLHPAARNITNYVGEDIINFNYYVEDYCGVTDTSNYSETDLFKTKEEAINALVEINKKRIEKF